MDDTALRNDVAIAVEEYERLIGGYASYTRRMLDQLGPVQALSKLMADSKIQKGLRTLAKAQKLEISFEAAVLKHRAFFPQQIVEAAEWRLNEARAGRFS
jgi:hypothetical protein